MNVIAQQTSLLFGHNSIANVIHLSLYFVFIHLFVSVIKLIVVFFLFVLQTGQSDFGVLKTLKKRSISKTPIS